LQFTAPWVLAHLLRREQTGVDHGLHHTVISRAREDQAIAKKVQTRVTGMTPERLLTGEVDEQRDHGAVHVPGGVGLGLMPPQLCVGIDQQVLDFVGARQRCQRGLIDDVAHDELGGDVAAAVSTGPVGDHTAQALLALPMATGILVAGAPASTRQDRKLDLRRVVIDLPAKVAHVRPPGGPGWAGSACA
jgi:hypothetical protein